MPPPIILFHFTDGANHAETDGREWHRRADEEQAEFEARVVSDPAFADVRRGFVVWFFD